MSSLESVSLDLSETLYKWWDTFRDILIDPEFVNAIEIAILFLQDCDDIFDWETYGDKIRFVFQRDKGVSKLLANLRTGSLFTVEKDTKKMISMVLLIEDLKKCINSYPNSIKDIGDSSITSLIDQALNNTFRTWWDNSEDDENTSEDIMMSSYERFERLIGMGFPIISKEGDIVMFYENWEEEALVWDNEMVSTIKMTKEWDIIVPKDEEKEKITPTHSVDKDWVVRPVFWKKS